MLSKRLPILAGLALCLGLGSLLTSCSKSSAPAGDTATGAKPLTLSFVTNNASPFWTIARAGCEKAVSELPNVTLDFRIPSSGGSAEQQQLLDDLLARGVDGIAVSPIDPTNQTDMLNRVAAQTLLITHDSDAPASNRVCYIGTDNVAAGVAAGKLIKQALPDGGRIMLFVGTMDAQNAKQRHEGITKELAGSNVQIIDVRTDETDRVRAQKNVEDTLVKYPDVACLVGLWSYNGPAIVNAVRGSDSAGQVKIVCFDEEDEVLDAVKSGMVFGTVVQQPYEFGYQAITRMARYLRGDKEALAGGRQIVPTLDVTSKNVDEFRARLNSILGK
jgi:ribose transport system substrate-binding protein